MQTCRRCPKTVRGACACPAAVVFTGFGLLFGKLPVPALQPLTVSALAWFACAADGDLPPPLPADDDLMGPSAGGRLW